MRGDTVGVIMNPIANCVNVYFKPQRQQNINTIIIAFHLNTLFRPTSSELIPHWQNIEAKCPKTA